ncbi:MULTISPECIES: helix-turn-helix transcriptional regulator [Marinobacter]|uniref:helix-turn-helix transcriptional regulator n=1 Tax=Marinobacter TaxID=2742 RepID=UPI001BCCF1A3|nr:MULTISPECIES: WYL domain-containing protein [Marinobacter]MBS8230259.1 WYL domain-containing protein [Marinobacter salarius]|tara:strand:- start:13400 stop:14353 length:954 start_codon:yes stop_codon:yes gene_type:complete
MSDVAMRWLEMLRLIPRSPRKIDALALQSKLAEQGYRIGLRSLQRDLQDASRRFPLLCDEEQRPFRWYYPRDYVFDLPAMTPPVALAFSLLNQHTAHLLPLTAKEQLMPWFSRANAVLDAQPNGLSEWRDKVRVIPDWMPTLPPTIDPVVLETIHTALLQRVQFEGWYQGRRDLEPKQLTVNPLALVSSRQTFYVVGTLWSYEDPVQLAVHRFTEVEQHGISARNLEAFDIDSYIQSGAFGVTKGDPIRVKLRFENTAGLHVKEMPISNDQHIAPDGDDHFILTATVPNNLMLRWWIASFEDRVELIEPALAPKKSG